MKLKMIDYGYTKLPNRAHYNDSGADVYSTIDTVINPNSICSIPLGFGLELPDGYDIVVHCKSGLSNKGIWSSNAPIDAGYKGEIHAILYNTTSKEFKIEKGMKIGQLVLRPVIYCDFVESLGEERDTGAFGSTGK